MVVQEKICSALDCKIEEIVEVVNVKHKLEDFQYGKQEI